MNLDRHPNKLKRSITLLLASALLLMGCSADPAFVAATPSAAKPATPSAAKPATPSAAKPATPSAAKPATQSAVKPATRSAVVDTPVVIVGTGDIAEAGAAIMANAKSTAALVRAAKPRFVFTTGDNAYPVGSRTDYAKKYNPAWGSFKAMTRPVPGNHEYRTARASGYRGYFGAAKVSNSRNRGVYYAYNLGNGWRAYALNSEISMSATSAQYAWLRSDLRAHPNTHFLAYWHQPRFVSKVIHGDRTDEAAIWNLLRLHGTDIVMTGHEHHAERFAKMNGSGARDPKGIREFVTGTGGNRTYGLPKRLHTNSQFANGYHYGVLKLTLYLNSYRWAFIASGRAYNGSSHVNTRSKGRVLDSGTTATNKKITTPR